VLLKLLINSILSSKIDWIDCCQLWLLGGEKAFLIFKPCCVYRSTCYWSVWSLPQATALISGRTWERRWPCQRHLSTHSRTAALPYERNAYWNHRHILNYIFDKSGEISPVMNVDEWLAFKSVKGSEIDAQNPVFMGWCLTSRPMMRIM